MKVGMNNRKKKVSWRTHEYVIIKHHTPPVQPTGQRGVKGEIAIKKQANKPTVANRGGSSLQQRGRQFLGGEHSSNVYTKGKAAAAELHRDAGKHMESDISKGKIR